MRGNEHFEQNDDGDYVDDDGERVTPKDFQEGRKFEDKLKKKVKCSLKKQNLMIYYIINHLKYFYD